MTTGPSPQEAVDRFDAVAARLVAINRRRSALADAVASANAEAERLRGEGQEWTRAADLLRSFSDESSEKLKGDIERLVTHGLRTVFDDAGMEFRVITRLLRGSSSIEFALSSDGVERPILGSHGGGVAQVVGFVLRVVVTLLSSARPVLILDEPFSAVSPSYRPRLAAFLRELCDATPLQLVLVTHDEETPEVADVFIRFSRGKGPTVFEEVEQDA